VKAILVKRLAAICLSLLTLGQCLGMQSSSPSVKQDIDEQIAKAVLAGTSTKPKQFCFVAIAYPSSPDEFWRMRGSAVVVLSVLAKSTEATRIRNVRWTASGESKPLIPASVLESLEVQKKEVARALGERRTDYLYPIELAKIKSGTRLAVLFEEDEPPIEVSLPDAPSLPFAIGNARPDVADSQTYIMAIKGLVKRELPEMPFETLVRMSQATMQKQMLKQVNPSYPIEAKRNYVTGSVTFRVIVGKDGAVKSMKLITGPHLLVPAAYEAIRQWKYRPLLLNGEPVEVETSITINFSLG
jgi:TonB family protein